MTRVQVNPLQNDADEHNQQNDNHADKEYGIKYHIPEPGSLFFIGHFAGAYRILHCDLSISLVENKVALDNTVVEVIKVTVWQDFAHWL